MANLYSIQNDYSTAQIRAVVMSITGQSIVLSLYLPCDSEIWDKTSVPREKESAISLTHLSPSVFLDQTRGLSKGQVKCSESSQRLLLVVELQ